MKKIHLPELLLEAWEETQITLHLWLQIVGKLKLELMPKRNHWWHITLLVSSKGLTTGPIPHDKGNFTFEFNFVDHKLELTTSWGFENAFKLEDGLSVAGFYDRIYKLLAEIGLDPKILGVPYDHPCKEPFAECETHQTYQADYVNRFFQILVFSANVLKEFSGHFMGKVSPVQLYWHHMDLAVTRFSGEPGPPMWENATKADQEAYSHEVISAGFWSGDQNVRAAAYYSYTYPSPEGIDQKSLKPEVAHWQDANGSPMAMLMYDDLLKADDPHQALLDFLETTYDAGAQSAGWPEGLKADPPLEE